MFVCPCLLSDLYKLHEVMPDFDFLSEADLACDVVCLVYDVNNPRSFEYCAKVYKVYFWRWKCLLVALSLLKPSVCVQSAW